jgi:hypothetical protein
VEQIQEKKCYVCVACVGERPAASQDMPLSILSSISALRIFFFMRSTLTSSCGRKRLHKHFISVCLFDHVLFLELINVDLQKRTFFFPNRLLDLIFSFPKYRSALLSSYFPWKNMFSRSQFPHRHMHRQCRYYWFRLTDLFLELSSHQLRHVTDQG